MNRYRLFAFALFLFPSAVGCDELSEAACIREPYPGPCISSGDHFGEVTEETCADRDDCFEYTHCSDEIRYCAELCPEGQAARYILDDTCDDCSEVIVDGQTVQCAPLNE